MNEMIETSTPGTFSAPSAHNRSVKCVVIASKTATCTEIQLRSTMLAKRTSPASLISQPTNGTVPTVRPGTVKTSVMAAANYPGESVGRLSASIRRTLLDVFSEVLVAPGERHTFMAGVRPGVVSLDPAVLAGRIAGRGDLQLRLQFSNAFGCRQHHETQQLRAQLSQSLGL